VLFEKVICAIFSSRCSLRKTLWLGVVIFSELVFPRVSPVSQNDASESMLRFTLSHVTAEDTSASVDTFAF